MHHLGAGARLEQLDGVVRQAADAAGAVVELAGIGLRVGDQLGHRLYRQILLDDDRLHDRADDADRRQVLHWIVSELLGKRRDRDGADAADAEGVAIRRRARDVLGPDDAAGAHPAFNNDRFSQRLFDVTRGQAADQVGVTTGAIGHNESDGSARPCILRVRPVRRPRHPQCQRQCCNMLHRVLLLALGARQASSLPLREFMEPRSLGKRRHVARAGVATSRRRTLQPFRVGTWGGSSRRAGLGNTGESDSETLPAWRLLKPCHTVARKEVTGCRPAGRALCGAVAPC